MTGARSGLNAIQYARAGDDAARSAPTRRSVLLAGGALVAVVVAAFIALGLWQWRKAEAKDALQALFTARGEEPAVRLDAAATATELLAGRRVAVRGRYDARYQILIDNRLHRGRAGYHVVTPLQIDGSELRVLVNRGWIPAAADRRLPAVSTPDGIVDVQAVATVPGSRFLTLAGEAGGSGWQPLWQNLDLARYRQQAPFPVHPQVLQLAAHSDGGGFVRDWPRPDAGSARHRAYAWQWFAFAATAVGIWLRFLVRLAGPQR